MMGATPDCEVEDERLVTSVASSHVVGKCFTDTTLLRASSEVYGKQD